jgi:hypothetical protein
MAQEPYREAHIEDPEDLRALGTFLDDVDLVSEYSGQLDTTNHVSLEGSSSDWTITTATTMTTTANEDELETFSSSDLEGDDWEVDSTAEPITKDIFSNKFPSRPHLHNTLPGLEDVDSEGVSPPPPLHRQVTPPNMQARLRAFLKESNQFIQGKIQPPTYVRPNDHHDSIMEDSNSAEAKTPTSSQVAPRRVSHDNAKLRSLLAAKKLANTPKPKQILKVKISTKIPLPPLVTPPKKPRKIRGPRKKVPEVKTPVQKTAFDVLMGRGGCSNHHTGNEAYRNRILQLQPVYKALVRKKKTDFSASVVSWVQDRGGRFLNRDTVGGPWYVVPDAMARQKVSQALREDHSEQGRDAKKAKTTTGSKK